MHEFISALFQYYGLDWVSMGMGLAGYFMISSGDKRGFIVSSLGCAFGLSVAILSGQTGFIAYNAILMAIMYRGFLNWDKAQPVRVSS